MKLHDNTEDFKALIALTREHFGIADVLVEKDYWVTLALKNLSTSPLAGQVVFKGGTSLSKAHKMIFRFSEDIDLAVIVQSGATAGQIKNQIKAVEKACTIGFTEVQGDPRISKHGEFRKTVWEFKKLGLEKDYGDAGEHILIEVNSFTKPEPAESMDICSLISEYLIEKKDFKTIAEYGLESYKFEILKIERTFVEKISALTKNSYLSEQSEYDLLKKHIRHFYDLTKLIQKCEASVLNEPAYLIELLAKVKKDDQAMNNGSGWTSKKYKDAPIFNNFDAIWPLLSPAYHGQFKSMLYGRETLPSEKNVREAVMAISEALKKHE